MRFSKTFKQFILPAIILGLCGIIGIYIQNSLSKNDHKPATKNTTETRSPDGTITTNETIVYK